MTADERIRLINELKVFLARIEAKLDAELARQAKQKEER